MSIKYDYNMEVFFNEDEISYYLLGAFITDGCVYKNKNTNAYACQLSSCDYDWLESIKNIIGNNLKLHKFRDNYYGIRITRDVIARWFLAHGCFVRKTYSVKLPEMPDKYFPDFIRGCIDGDGSIGEYFHKKSSKRVCQIISASKIFLEKIQEKLANNDIKSHLINRGKKSGNVNGKIIKANVDSYSLSIYGTNCYKLLKFAYYKNHKISLARKHNIAKNIINFYESSEIVDKRKMKPLNVGCKITWPSNDDLIDMINKSNVEQVAKKLQIHPMSIRNRLRNRNLYDKIIKYQKVHLPPNEELLELLKIHDYVTIAKKLNIGYKTLLKKMKERGLI